MRNFLETSSKLLGLLPQTAKLTNKEVIDIRSDLLVDLLINLRQELSAMAVTIIDDRGKVIGSAGDPPEENLTEKIIPYVINLTGSVARLSGSMQPEMPENVISIRGSQYDLVISPINGYILLVFLKHVRSSVRMAIVFDALVTAMGDLQQKNSSHRAELSDRNCLHRRKHPQTDRISQDARAHQKSSQSTPPRQNLPNRISRTCSRTSTRRK